MRRLLNTLYVTTEGTYLTRDGETVTVSVEGETKLQVPIHMLGSIICFGPVNCTPPLLALCAERHVSVAFYSMYGRFQSRLEGPVSGNVLLRREQYRHADRPDAAACIARSIVIAKITNCRTVLLRASRDNQNSLAAAEQRQAVDALAKHLSALENVLPLEEIRGHEGDAARTYFSVFDHLITIQKEDFTFSERSRRPPLDNVNALLSFIYVVLSNDVTSALEGVGLDPSVGYLHSDRPGRYGLALDVMEEFRAYLADRLAMNLINLRQITPKGFTKTESGAIVMDDDTRKTILTEYQKRKTEEITHPFLGEKVPIGLLPHVQATLLARYLRGDMDGYPPFIFR